MGAGEGEVPQLLSFIASTNLSSICKLIAPLLTQQKYWFSCWLSPFTHSPAYYQPAFSFPSSHSHTHSSLPLHTGCTQEALCWEIRPHHSDHPKSKNTWALLPLEEAGQGNEGKGGYGITSPQVCNPPTKNLQTNPKQLAYKNPDHFQPRSFLSPDNGPAILHYILFLNSLGVWTRGFRLGADPICSCPIIRSCNLEEKYKRELNKPPAMANGDPGSPSFARTGCVTLGKFPALYD